MLNDSKPSTPRIPRDVTRVNIFDAAEMKYWATQLGVTVKQLATCVTRVGMNVPDIRRSLGK